jgi:hypothetical protein
MEGAGSSYFSGFLLLLIMPYSPKCGAFQISYNVPAVYDVFASPIKERGAFQGLQKCAGEKTHKGRSPTEFFRRPSPLLRAQHIQSCYMTWARIPLFYIYTLFFSYNIIKTNPRIEIISKIIPRIFLLIHIEIIERIIETI